MVVTQTYSMLGNYKQASQFSGNKKFHLFPGYFQVKTMEFEVILALNQCLFIFNM